VEQREVAGGAEESRLVFDYKFPEQIKQEAMFLSFLWGALLHRYYGTENQRTRLPHRFVGLLLILTCLHDDSTTYYCSNQTNVTIFNLLFFRVCVFKRHYKDATSVVKSEFRWKLLV